MYKFTLAILIFFLTFPLSLVAQINVLMSTSEGDITLELYTDTAPITAGNFLNHADNGDFDDASFYRVVTYENDKGSPLIEVIQGGLGDRADEFMPIPHETTEQSGILHTDGVISMAREAVGTASTEFFIILGNQPSLDYKGERNADMQGFAAFGKVVDGMDVVRKIHQLPADGPSDSDYTIGQILTEAVSIQSVRRIE
ncbi:MAG: peptidylprolyl isomerase [Pseudohongiellaceae bacterium]|jgi:peptidyl-prolyl cis-trans isomerase A (cyclophilin A)